MNLLETTRELYSVAQIGYHATVLFAKNNWWWLAPGLTLVGLLWYWRRAK